MMNGDDDDDDDDDGHKLWQLQSLCKACPIAYNFIICLEI